MRNIILGSLFALTLGASAYAQDYGLTAGFSQSTAKGQSTLADTSASGVFGFRLGGVAAFPLTDQVKFRTGFIYAQRHFELKDSATDTTLNHKFDYLDIPALVQYNFDETWGVFGGLVAAINVNKSIDVTGLGAATANGMTTLLPLLQLGVNATFDNMYGVEAYYEMGFGDIYRGAKNYSVFGANFIYWL